MAIYFCDSFDHYTTYAQLQLKWFNAQNGPAPSAVGRNGTNGFAMLGTLDRSIPNLTSGGEAWARKWAAFNQPVFYLFDGATAHVSLQTDVSGFIQLLGPAGGVVATSSEQMTIGVYYHLEAKWTIANSGGSFELRVNGVSKLSYTGDTQATANNYANIIRHYGGNTNHIDDVVGWDTTGSVNNNWIGDVRVQCILPSGNGNSSALTGSDGNSTDNYLLVDESTPNSDTDYVESSVVGDKDTYAYGNLTPTTGTVAAVCILPYARKTDAGTRSIVTVARLSGTETDGPTRTLTTTYDYLDDIRETKPGGGAWSISDVNNAEFGVKVNE